MREETKIHRKSRLGCLTCKRRKVKCDETRPECIKCFKFGVTCDYSSSNIQASHSSPSPSNTASSRPRGRPRSDWASWAEQIRISSAAQSRSSSEAGSSCLCDTPRLNVDDLEVFYNYLNNTASTLGDESHHAMWQKGVPELGFQYPCVLDLILALSALHLARKRPENRTKYEAIAEQHSTAALQAATALMKDMSKDNCPALYISAVLICFTSFAKGPSPGNMLVVADDGQVPWLSLIRGVRFVVSNMGWSAVFSGVLAKYAPQGTDPQNEEIIAKSLTPSTLAATGSEDWRTSLEMISDLFTVLPSQQCRYIYMREVESLVSHLEATFGSGTDALPGTVGKMENTMGWMYSIQEDFVKRLSQRHPVALIILGHFCVLLRTLEGYWFMQGWAQHVMREVIAATDEACHKWLAWPIKFLEDANSMRSNTVTP